jgi:MFS family permease
MTVTRSDLAQARRARAAVVTFFFINGALFGSWVSRIPDIRGELGLSKGLLGTVLLGLAIGAVLGLPLAGAAVSRRGSRTITVASTIAYCAALPLLALAPSALTLALSLATFGIVASGLDVAMNVQGAMVERIYGRSIMSSLHAFFNLGGFAGAAGGVIALTVGAPPGAHFVAAAIVLLLTGLVAWTRLLVDSRVERLGTLFVRPTRTLTVLAAVSFCVLLAEGAMADWSALFLRSETGAGASRAALGFAVFSAAMTAGRFAGDAITERFGRAIVVRWGGATASLGLIAALTTSTPFVAIAGFALTGVGLAVSFPLALSSAAIQEGSPSTNIAAVSTAGYSGFMVGPPTIGIVAEASSLRLGLGIVAVLTTIVYLLGRYASSAFATAAPSSVES